MVKEPVRLGVCASACARVQVCVRARVRGTRIHCKPIRGGLSFCFQDSQFFSHGVIGREHIGIRKGPVPCRPS